MERMLVKNSTLMMAETGEVFAVLNLHEPNDSSPNAFKVYRARVKEVKIFGQYGGNGSTRPQYTLIVRVSSMCDLFSVTVDDTFVFLLEHEEEAIRFAIEENKDLISRYKGEMWVLECEKSKTEAVLAQLRNEPIFTARQKNGD